MKLTVAAIDKMVDGLLKPIVDRKKAIRNEVADIVAKHIAKSYPKEIQKLIVAKSPFLRRTSSIRVRVMGEFSYIDFNEPVVVSKDDCHVIEGKDGEKIIDLWNERKRLVDKYNKNERELYSTLKLLGSDVRVRKEFPEAAMFLPTEQDKTVPAVNLERLRLDLKTLI